MGDSPKILLKTRRFNVVEAAQSLDNGSLAERQWVEHPGAVVILPLLVGNSVCLIENFRIAVNQTLIELPAGTLEPNEPPAATAERELLEETGYRAGRIEKIHEFFMSPGILNERMHLYVATELTPGAAQREPGEQIQNLVVAWDEAMAMAMSGQIQDAKTLAALMLYDRMLHVRKDESGAYATVASALRSPGERR
ncbi:MAG: NUDIX hydrolase [Planctomycetales bacterium]|nr:NUDIX hydrolase [Planctomycetales bacterium]